MADSLTGRRPAQPATPLSTFADIPGEVRRRLDAGERVLLVLLDAFGLEFLSRHAEHPLVRRLAVTPLAAQFPSTTTAHVTTAHLGVPVAEHGLYEWLVYEPAVDEVVCPLRSASERAASTLVTGPTFYEALGVESLVAQPVAIADSPFTRRATRGARRLGFSDLATGAHAVARAFRAWPQLRYAFLYWDGIDRVGHERGPASGEFHAAAGTALDALATGLGRLEGVTVLLTADHGQIDVGPDRVDYLDELWPGLSEHLSHPRPAGSSRDAFLHVRPGSVTTVVAELSRRLGARARVGRAADLFAAPGPRLRARLAEIVVLPSAGRQAWLAGAASNERWFRGHHGGLEPAETAVYLAELEG